ncbi:MAG: hypothetical protein ACI4WS_06155, partial [Oscillospiraceae bacterium]
MIEYHNECVGCPPEMGCYGDACVYSHIPHFFCDECGMESEPEMMRRADGLDLCPDCLLKYALQYFPEIK